MRRSFMQPQNTNPIQPTNKGHRILILILVILLTAGVVGGGTYYFLNAKKAAKTEEPKADTVAKKEKEVSKDGIEWQEPKEITSLNLFQKDDVTLFDRGKTAKYYKVGTFLSGKYKDGEIILLSAEYDGPAVSNGFYRFVKSGDNLVMLTRHSDGRFADDGFKKGAFEEDKITEIKTLSFPVVLSGADPRQALELDGVVNEFFKKTGLKKVFTDENWGDVYTNEYVAPEKTDGTFTKNGFYLKAPDGTARIYSYKNDFLDKDGYFSGSTTIDPQTILGKYSVGDLGGCGRRNYATVVDVLSSDLKKIGENAKGDILYVTSNPNHKLMKEFYEKTSDENGNKLSYAEYLTRVPLIFFTDPFGRMIMLENMDLIAEGGCGKPVIYLYPEKKN